MVRPREKYATAITATDPPNIAIGTHRNHRFRSQRSAYQLQKTPSAIGSAKAPNADPPPARARRPSAKSVANAATDVQRVVGAAAAQDGSLTAGLAREVLEGQSPREGRRTTGFRTSGIVVSSLGGIKSREKMVWDWTDPADRVIEEFR